MRVYLSGGMMGLTDEQMHGWRDQAKEMRPDIGWIDPTIRDFRGHEHEFVDTIVEGDKQDIDTCDLIFVYAVRPSWGTAMEIMYAYEHGIPLWIYTEDPFISVWVIHHADRLSNDFEGLVKSIPSSVEDLRRPVTVPGKA